MITEAELIEVLRKQVAEAGGPANYARARKVWMSTMVSILTGKLGISPSIAAAMGYRKKIMYEEFK